MLKEIKDVKQESGNVRKRWFSDDYFDLIVWENEEKDIVTFQLCYNINVNEHAFYWVADQPTTHHKVDDGDRPGAIKRTPVLLPESRYDALKILKKFIDHSGLLEKATAKFIVRKIYELSKNQQQ